MNCHVCLAPLAQPMFSWKSEFCVTSHARLRPGGFELFFCEECGHWQKNALQDTSEFYDGEYRFLSGSVDEDQLYQVVRGENVYRSRHQLAVLRQKLTIPRGARVLDYGCAKSPTMRALVAERPDIVGHLFDVTDDYCEFWKTFLPEERWACYEPRAEWRESFDLIFSLFALEHAPQPREFAAAVSRLLRPGGTFYFLVPNPYGANMSDMLVVDHVNHFSAQSLSRLLAEAGLELVELDEEAHDLAYVGLAVKRTPSRTCLERQPTAEAFDHARRVCRFWTEAAERIERYEREHAGDSVIYGAGIVGCYIATCLKNREKFVGFVDRNPHKQGQWLAARPIMAPAEFPRDSAAVYVGLNPARARQAEAEMNSRTGAAYDYFYL